MRLLLQLCVAGLCVFAVSARAQTADKLVSTGPSVAALPIEVATRTSIPAHEEEPSPTAARSSLDDATASAQPWNAKSGAKPWDIAPQAPAPSLSVMPVDTAAVVQPKPATIASVTAQGFIGDATPLSCQPAPYRVIIDTRAELSGVKLCRLSDDSWLLAP